MDCPHRKKGGFTLTEVVIALIVGTVVFGTLVEFFAGFERASSPREMLTGSITGTTQIYPEAPDVAQTINALEFHRVFRELLRQADRVYVTGTDGADMSSFTPPERPSARAYYQAGALRSFPAIESAPVRDLSTSSQFFASASSAGGAGFVTVGQNSNYSGPRPVSGAGFSVYMVRGSRVIGVATAYRRLTLTSPIRGQAGNRIAFECVLMRPDLDPLAYRIMGRLTDLEMVTGTNVWQMGMAVHWLRYDRGNTSPSTVFWGRREVGRYVVVFPDPWTASGESTGSGSTNLRSRFRYVIPFTR